MADKKISELTTITGANTASGDLFVIVDVDANETKKITRDELTNALELTDFDNIDINGGTIDGTPIGGSTPAAGTFTTLTANGNVVLGDAATDTVTVTADVASDLIPSVDGSFDLGASGAEWQDLFIDGTANIDSLVADTADINGGTIDGTTIGGASAGAGTFTGVNVVNASDDPALIIFGNNDSSGTKTTLRFHDTDTGAVSGQQLGKIEFYSNDPGNSSFGPAVYAEIDVQATSTQPGSQFTFKTVAISGNSLRDRMKIADNGDISFYEDTGTTPKFFWDASAERLGIGNVAPATALDVTGTVTADGLTVAKTPVNYSTGVFSAPHVALKASVQPDDNDGFVGATFATSSSDNFGWSAGAERTSGGNGDFVLTQHFNSVTGTQRMRLNSGGDISFYEDTGTTPKLFWDSSEETLLVGKTVRDSTTAGAYLNETFGGVIVRDGGNPLLLNRLTTDGDIAVFRKDGTTIGSIGVVSGLFSVGSGDAGIKFWSGGDAIAPSNPDSSHANRDASIDIGTSANRFKDLYLSGSVYLGGTTSANALDDYEEGTWTPAFINVSAPSYSSQIGRYVKVGQICYFTIQVVFTGLDTTDLSAAGFTLPFTPDGTTAQGSISLVGGSGSTAWSGTATLNPTAIITSSATFSFQGLNDPDTYDYDSGNFATSGQLTVTGTYRTT